MGIDSRNDSLVDSSIDPLIASLIDSLLVASMDSLMGSFIPLFIWLVSGFVRRFLDSPNGALVYSRIDSVAR